MASTFRGRGEEEGLNTPQAFPTTSLLTQRCITITINLSSLGARDIISAICRSRGETHSQLDEMTLFASHQVTGDNSYLGDGHHWSQLNQ